MKPTGKRNMEKGTKSRWACIAALLAAALLLAGCASGPDAEAIEGVVTLEDEQSPFVAFNIWLKVGAQHDPRGKEGLAAMTAALLEEGSTEQDGYEEILAKLYPMAAGYSSSVDKEMTVFRGRVHVDNLEAYYELFKNAILSPAFKPEDFQRLKARAMSFLRERRRFSSDEELGKELLFRRIFRGTPYEHPEEGYVQSVDSITLEDVKQFYVDHYKRGSVVVGLAGRYPEGFPRRVRDDFDQLPEGEAPKVDAPRAQPIDGINVLIVEKNTNATAISMGFPIDLLRSHDDFYAMMLANSWLGEHRNASGRLYQAIREARGMNYGDYTYIEAYPMGHTISLPPQNVARRKQIFQIWIRPVSQLKGDDLHNRALFASRAALRELEELVEEGLSEEEFEVTRGFLKNYTVNFGNTLSRRLGYRIDDHFYGISGEGHLASIQSELEELTLEQVNEAVRRHLQCDDMWIVFITRDAEALKEKLVSGAESPIAYPGDKPDEILEEDRLIQSYALDVKEENIEIVSIHEVLEK